MDEGEIVSVSTLYIDCIDNDKFTNYSLEMKLANIMWDKAKNVWLKANRAVSFEGVVAALASGKLIDDLVHPQRPNQRIFILELHHHMCAVPVVTNEGIVFLKTIYPDRKLNVRYRKES
jgi:hypothetical protein